MTARASAVGYEGTTLFHTPARSESGLVTAAANTAFNALWDRIAVELDEAKLVQLDRLRVGQQGLSLRELADQLGRAGRTIVRGIVKA